jgi:hypothetical protein
MESSAKKKCLWDSLRAETQKRLVDPTKCLSELPGHAAAQLSHLENSAGSSASVHSRTTPEVSAEDIAFPVSHRLRPISSLYCNRTVRDRQ